MLANKTKFIFNLTSKKTYMVEILENEKYWLYAPKKYYRNLCKEISQKSMKILPNLQNSIGLLIKTAIRGG